MAKTERQQQATLGAEPQREHGWLKRLVGEWAYQFEAEPEPGGPAERLTGTESVRMLGGLWLLAEGRGQVPGGGEATTLMTLGYDPDSKRFVGTWIGSMMTHLWIYEAELGPDERLLTLESEGPAMGHEGPITGSDGRVKTTRYREVIELKSDDHRTLTSHMLTDDGKWEQMMFVDYRRRR